MAEAQRFAIALVACVFFLSSLPFVSADANSDNGLSLEISSNDNGRVYFEGEILQIQSTVIIRNAKLRKKSFLVVGVVPCNEDPTFQDENLT